MNLEGTRVGSVGGFFSGPLDLAHVEPFQINDIRVVPAERRLIASGGRQGVLEPLAMQVLVALTQAGGRTLSRDDLVAECWGRRIVGDDAVNRVISRLRRGLETICGSSIRIETIAKVGYRLNLADTTAAQENPAAERPTASTPIARRYFATAAALLAVVVTGGAMFAGSPAKGVAIAIEPAGGEGVDQAADRFAGDLTSDVAQLTESMTRLTLVEPGASVEADMRLEVSYGDPAGGGNARVRLVDGANGAVIWSRSFEREGVSDALVRERAAHAIAGVIRCGLDRSTGNLGDPVSKRLYFSACDAVDARDWPRALSFANQIAERRPQNAASWACLAMTTAYAGSNGTAGEREKSAKDAMAYARRSLAIDPKSGLAHQALGMALELQGKSGFAAYEDGVRMDPEHGWLLSRYSWGLFDLGYVNAAIGPGLRSVALEPGDQGAAIAVLYTLLGAGRLADARQLSDRIGRVWEETPGADRARSNLLFYARDPVAALAQYDADPSTGPFAPIDRAELVWRSDPARFDWAAFDRTATRLYHDDPQAAWRLAFSAARVRDSERAFGWLHRAKAIPGEEPWFWLFWSDAAELRRDPRFLARMAALGLVDEWRRRARWPDFCTDPGLRYDCRREAARLAANTT